MSAGCVTGNMPVAFNFSVLKNKVTSIILTFDYDIKTYLLLRFD